MNGINDAVRLFRAAGDPTRVRILLALQQRSLCVCELVALVDVGQPAVSRHLAILQDARLVESVRNGRWVDYRLVAPVAADPATDPAARLVALLRQVARSDPAAADLQLRARGVDRRQLADGSIACPRSRLSRTTPGVSK